MSNLPIAENYEKSYMHRDTITHMVVTWYLFKLKSLFNNQSLLFNIKLSTDFIITASIDGHIKFWKKQELGIEFVKHFRGHLGNIQDAGINSSGTLLCTISNDKSLKVFDVVNFGV